MVDYDDSYALAAAAPHRLRGDVANLGYAVIQHLNAATVSGNGGFAASRSAFGDEWISVALGVVQAIPADSPCEMNFRCRGKAL